jgi:hypothetical protein
MELFSILAPKASYVARVLWGLDDSLSSPIADFGETFDWLAMSQQGTSGSRKSSLRGVVLLVTLSETPSVRPGLEEPVAPKKQVIISQSDEEPEQ